VTNAASPHAARGQRVLERHRLLIRRDPAVWPFVWRGLLPMLGLLVMGLYAVGPFARGEIEANVTRAITQALRDKGLDDIAVNVSGQDVLLNGTLPAGVPAPQAISIAQRATCPTFAGPQVCAERVQGKFESAPAQPAVVSLPSLPSTSSPPGAVKQAPAATPTAVTAADRASCERALADVMSRQRIEFATGSAVLLPSSGTVLDDVARAHAGCQGIVRIEGHTDDRGLPAANQTLSLDRALAVRQELVKRGVPAQRLQAEGFGPKRPLADNRTAQGRQQNRRIEFKAAAGN
jgi:outer membrane protein OmpA-like peptidoglycan-associated protein